MTQTTEYDPLAGVGELVDIYTGNPVEEPTTVPVTPEALTAALTPPVTPTTIIAVSSPPRTGDRSVRAATPAPEPLNIEIDPSMPWAGWSRPTIHPANLHELQVRPGAPQTVDDGHMVLVGPGEERLGLVSSQGIQELGWHAAFPKDFIGKLPTDLAAVVINNRIQSVTDKRFSVIEENGEFVNMTPEWHEVLAYPDTAQVAYDTLVSVYGHDSISVRESYAIDGKMSLRIMTDIERPITPKVGDILQMGVRVRQSYGQSTWSELYTERLACLNGMTAMNQEFRWNQRAQGTAAHQAAWLRQGILSCTEAYNNLCDRATRMANTQFHGDYHDVLREHARAMSLPIRHFAALVQAFEAEPGDTMWHIVNAFTRFATHGGLNPATTNAILASSGDYVGRFDMVTARLPLPLAQRIGAELIESAS